MTYLQLCQRTHLLLGMGSRGNTAKPGTVPTSVSGQTDELAEIVEWAKLAWIELQNEARWGWLIQQGTLAFTSGDATVVPTATLATYRDLIPFTEAYGMGNRRYVLSYLTSAGQVAEQKVYYMEVDEFRGWRDRETVPTGRPQYFTINPDQTWEVSPEPDAGYTLRFDYIVKPKVFTTSDGAVSLEDYPATGRGLPGDMQEVVAWKAVRYWAETRGNAPMYQVAMRRIKELMIPIRRIYLPPPRFM